MATNRYKRFVWPTYVAVLLATAGSTLVVMGGHAMSMGSHSHDSGSAMHMTNHGHDDADETETNVTANASCDKVGATIEMTVTDVAFAPKNATATLCDRLVVHNASKYQVEAAIGAHDHHLNYPNFEEQMIQPGETASGVLRARGTYEIHDHLNDTLQAEITIK